MEAGEKKLHGHEHNLGRLPHFFFSVVFFFCFVNSNRYFEGGSIP